MSRALVLLWWRRAATGATATTAAARQLLRGRSRFRGESERKERTVGSFEHTPQHLYDVDGPCFGFDESGWSCSGGGDWGDYDHGSS
jgi:hypothetical protein